LCLCLCAFSFFEAGSAPPPVAATVAAIAAVASMRRSHCAARSHKRTRSAHADAATPARKQASAPPRTSPAFSLRSSISRRFCSTDA
jgi:hypothetical protein